MPLLATTPVQGDDLQLLASRTLAWPPVSFIEANVLARSPSPLALSQTSTVDAGSFEPPKEAGADLTRESTCAAMGRPRWHQLGLGEALALNLCKSPSLRQALSAVAQSSAGLALAQSAQEASWNAQLESSNSQSLGRSAGHRRTLEAQLNLSWVLFDFGQSDASVNQARQMLASALALQSNAQLDAVRELVQVYGDAASAHASWVASQEAESTANLTAKASQARYDAGVGNQIDRLQAQTSLAQATLAKVRSESDWENARGKLALALGADIAQPMRLTEWNQWPAPNEVIPTLETLRAEAMSTHPRIMAVQAQIEASRANQRAVASGRKGSLALSASAGQVRQWESGTASVSSRAPQASVGLIATVPLFNHRASMAQEQQALAVTDEKEAELVALQREIDLLLWQAHRAVITSQHNVKASEHLLSTAQSTLDVAQGRYKAGVGSMIELLTAQSALADAQRQRVAAQVGKMTARTQLGLAAGRLGF